MGGGDASYSSKRKQEAEVGDDGSEEYAARVLVSLVCVTRSLVLTGWPSR